MKDSKNEMTIYERCEGCGRSVNQEKLVWDHEEDRLVCILCFIGKNIKKRKDH